MAVLKICLLLSALLLPLVASKSCTCSCDTKVEWPNSYKSNNGYEYVVVHNIKSYSHAQQECAALDGHLAYEGPRSSHYSKYLYSHFLKKLDFVYCYFGLHDQGREGKFLWEDGRSLSWTYWARGEPNNHKNEDCASYRKDGCWNDLPCVYPHESTKIIGLCERKR